MPSKDKKLKDYIEPEFSKAWLTDFFGKRHGWTKINDFTTKEPYMQFKYNNGYGIRIGWNAGFWAFLVNKKWDVISRELDEIGLNTTKEPEKLINMGLFKGYNYKRFETGQEGKHFKEGVESNVDMKKFLKLIKYIEKDMIKEMVAHKL